MPSWIKNFYIRHAVLIFRDSIEIINVSVEISIKIKKTTTKTSISILKRTKLILQ